MTDLRPCPFCGKKLTEDDFYSENGYPGGCGCIWDTHDAIDEETRWNTRPLESALQQKLDKAKACAERILLKKLYLIADGHEWIVDEATRLLKEWEE